MIAKRLEQFMQTKQPYLDPDLTIEALAKRMAVPRQHLTEVINDQHQKNFYLFVNEFRIQAVKQALKDPALSGETLLDIAHASGFSSKSPFNTAFKHLTGITPSQYRRQQQCPPTFVVCQTFGLSGWDDCYVGICQCRPNARMSLKVPVL